MNQEELIAVEEWVEEMESQFIYDWDFYEMVRDTVYIYYENDYELKCMMDVWCDLGYPKVYTSRGMVNVYFQTTEEIIWWRSKIEDSIDRWLEFFLRTIGVEEKINELEYQSEMNPYEEAEEDDKLRWDEYNDNFNHRDDLSEMAEKKVKNMFAIISNPNPTEEEEKELMRCIDVIRHPYSDYDRYIQYYYNQIAGLGESSS